MAKSLIILLSHERTYWDARRAGGTMDDFLRFHPMPWPWKAVIALLPALLICVAILFTPRSWLKRFAELPFDAPTALTLAHVPLFALGVYLHLTTAFYAGILLVAVAEILDIMDGKLAKFMLLWKIPRSEFWAKLGKILDPFCDKITLLPAIGLYMYLGYINPWLGWLVIMVDVFGTFMREPFLKCLDDSGANWIGKIKALFQAFGLLACMPNELGWYSETYSINLVYGLALILGVLSVYLRLAQDSSIGQVLSRANFLFKHQDL